MRRRVPLLKERAAVERLAFDYEAAKQSLAEVTRLAPDDVRAFIDLGDLYVITGPLDEATKSFRDAGKAARQKGDERNLSVSYIKIGDVQMAQGDADGALKSYSDSLARPLAKSDPCNALWQRDLSLSHMKIGDAKVAQGDIDAAPTSYKNAIALAKKASPQSAA